MIQVDNINEIKYLRNIFSELSKYEINIYAFQEKLKLIISQYEESKFELFNQNFQKNAYLVNVSDIDMALCMNLAVLKEELKYHILFLDVIRVTDDWNIDYDIDSVFYDVNKNFNVVLNILFKVDVQEFFISRFYDLLLKKVYKDYLSGNFTYLEKYNDLRNQVYLQDSIKRFLESDKINFSLSGNICNYSLIEIFEKVFSCQLKEDNIVESIVEVDSIKTEIVPVSDYNYFGKMLMNIYALIKDFHDNFMNIYVNRNSFLYKRRLLENRYPGVDLEWLGEVAEEVIERVGIDCVKEKNFMDCDLSGINLSSVCFTDVKILYANLMGTNAKINPQKVWEKNLAHSNLCELDLSDADFTDVYIIGCNLSRTNSKIDPQKVWDKNLNRCNLYGLDLSKGYFTSILISGANLKDTGAIIDLTKIELYESGFRDSLMKTNLEGCYVLDNVDFEKEGISLEKLGNPILIDSFEDVNSPLIKYSWLGKVKNAEKVVERVGIDCVERKDFTNCDFSGLDLSEVDFTGVKINGCNLKGTNAMIDPQLIYEENLEDCSLEGLDLSEANFTDVIISYTNLMGTNAKIDPQIVYGKNIYGCNLEGLDLSKCDFDGVGIIDANLKNTGAKINPQVLWNKTLDGCNLEGLNLSEANFNHIYVGNANLKDTRAKLDLNNICWGYDYSLCDYSLKAGIEGLNLSGCYVLDNIDFEKEGISLELLGNPTLIKVNNTGNVIESFNKNIECEEKREQNSKKLVKKL